MNMRLDVDRIVLSLAWCAGCLVLCGIASDWFVWGTAPPAAPPKLVAFLRLDAERNLPTVFSAVILLLGGASALLAWGKDLSEDVGKRFWLLYGLALVYMSLDEAFGWHERLHRIGLWLLGDWRPSALMFTWVVPAGGLVLMAAVFAFHSWKHLAAADRNRVLVAFVVFLGAALGVETLGGLAYFSTGLTSGPYLFLANLEEALEMAGGLLLLRSGLMALVGANAAPRTTTG